MIEFLTSPVVRILGPDCFQLAEEFAVKVMDFTIVVPAGFVSDLESVPRLPLVYALFKNRAPKSAILHDYLYTTREQPRNVADRIFLGAMEAEGLPWWMRRAMYAGVRVGGGFVYESDR